MNARRLSKKASLTAGALTALLLAAPAAQATLIGDTVNCGVVPSSLWACDLPSAVVGAGPEFRLLLGGSEFFNVDIGASSIRMNYTAGGGLSAGAGEVLTISDLDWVGMLGEIVGISNFMTAGTTGIVASDVTFTAHQVMIDFDNGAGFNAGQNTFLSFDLVTRHVPEPTTGALVALGMLAALGARRRRAAA